MMVRTIGQAQGCCSVDEAPCLEGAGLALSGTWSMDHAMSSAPLTSGVLGTKYYVIRAG